MEGEVSRRTMDRIAGVLLLAVAACSPAADEPTIRSGAGETRNTSGPLIVYVVNYPLLYFAERIGGAAVQAEFPAPPLGDPAYWQPGPARIAEYQVADVIVRNGATYAKWIDLVTLPESKVVDTSTRFSDGFITVEGAPTSTQTSRRCNLTWRRSTRGSSRSPATPETRRCWHPIRCTSTSHGATA